MLLLRIGLGVAVILTFMVLVLGDTSDELGLASEIVGGLLVGVIFIVYENAQQQKRESESNERTNALIRQVISEPGNRLIQSVRALPESNDEPAKEFNICRSQLMKYQETVLFLKTLIDTDRLDRGQPATKLLIEHFRTMEQLNTKSFMMIGVRTEVSNRQSLKFVAADAVTEHQALMHALEIT